MNCIRIERAQNGFCVYMDDPAIAKKNQKSNGPWADPEVEFVFDDEAEVIAFITKNLSKLMPDGKDKFSSSFDAAVEESEAEEKAEESKK